MPYQVIKNKVENINPEEKYFDIPVYKKKYPSCYQYNVLIMLAKRLIKQDANRMYLDKKFSERILK
ncbi:MAG: hypothetical protein A3I68_07740 [Candidatus Melainabacteria bacterium RIFCSPLOWO2_02_FULL_35_15]|nr:MAG: hypothetical protein A3F80_02785 [Candidatus Melainabacteria bacterium RIFCSPLOWO2_12_FULL_35_11]OGI14184.1 MAG: hypothetical protein A3I68_07740 [Candidatus Melainabacteria bacterium RIFCSPLOWO2_02_FULL_35_15]